MRTEPRSRTLFVFLGKHGHRWVPDILAEEFRTLTQLASACPGSSTTYLDRARALARSRRTSSWTRSATKRGGRPRGIRVEPALDVRGIGYGPRAMLPKEGVTRPDPTRTDEMAMEWLRCALGLAADETPFLGRSICCAASSEEKSNRWAVER
jgi:hypothetical protein